MKTAMVVGISGFVGKALVTSLVNHKAYKKVYALSRKDDRKMRSIHLVKLITDFEDLEPFATCFAQTDEVYCLMGSDYVRMHSESDQIQLDLVDYTFPLKVAQLAKREGVKAFFLLNPKKAQLKKDQPKMKLRAKLEQEISALDFNEFYVIEANRVLEANDHKSSVSSASQLLSQAFRFLGSSVAMASTGVRADSLAKQFIQLADNRVKPKQTA